MPLHVMNKRNESGIYESKESHIIISIDQNQIDKL